jgi:uncharacterized protein YjbJ (UPF0337 family)
MGAFRSLVVLSAGAAIGGALIIAHRISEESGKGIGESFAEVPGEAQRIFADVKARAEQASGKARDAYEQKQAEMDSFLHSGGAAE